MFVIFKLILCIIATESELKEKLLLKEDFLKKRSLENEKLQSYLKSKAGIVIKQFSFKHTHMHLSIITKCTAHKDL